MAIEEKNIPSVAETIAKFGGKHGSDAEEKKAIESVADAAIEGSMKGKSLYLAFSQVMDDGCMYFVVKSIKLSDAIDGRRRTSSTDSYSINSISSKLLRRVGYTALIDFGPCYVRCGLFHSSIVFAGMISVFDEARDGDEEIWVFEADENLKPNLRIKPFSMPTFNHIKYCPLLVELQGKLYALNGFKRTAKGGFMEVFDQTQNKWLSLPDPPTMTTKRDKLVSMVVAGQKILFSNPDVSGVFCFEPEIQNWKAIHSLGAGLPFEGPVTVFDDDACGGFLMFRYGCGKPNTMSVFFMSHQFDSIQTLKSVELPRLPREFYRRYQFGLDRLGVGGRNFCLVLNRFFTKDKYEFDGVVSDEFPQHNDKGILLFITFEYEITKPESGCELESKYKILNTNRIY